MCIWSYLLIGLFLWIFFVLAGNMVLLALKKIDNVRNLGAYVCKYITKDNLQEYGKRVFSCSVGLNRAREEVFYTEGYSTTEIGLHPDEVLQSLDVKFHTQMRTDWLDENGVAREQLVNYYQGSWSDFEISSW